MERDLLHNAVLYNDMMEQIKHRCSVINNSISAFRVGNSHLSIESTAEFCLLQSRMILELIAVSCIAAHYDVAHSKKNIETEWHAERIFSEFDKLKPGFWPTPDDDSKIYLIRSDVKERYKFFGRKLHAGYYITHVRPSKEVFQLSMFSDFVTKVWNLLEKHSFTLFDGSTHVHVTMIGPEQGRVYWKETRLIVLNK